MAVHQTRQQRRSGEIDDSGARGCAREGLGRADRVDAIAVDMVESVKSLSAEFRRRFEDDVRAWAKVRPLSELVAAKAKRQPGAEVRHP